MKFDKPGFGISGVTDLLREKRTDASGAITVGAKLSETQTSEIISFLKIKDLKVLKSNLKDSLSQEGIKETEDLLENLRYGGHDPAKVYAAYHNAVNSKDKPTVRLKPCRV